MFILGLTLMIARGCRDRESKVEDWSAPMVPDTDGQDERGTQAQLRPCSVEFYKSWNQRSWLCSDDTGFTATQSFTALTRNPGDSTRRAQLHQD